MGRSKGSDYFSDVTYVQFSIMMFSTCSRCLTFPVTMVMEFTTAVQPMRRSKSSMSVPNRLSRAFCLAYSFMAELTGNTFIPEQKVSTAVMLASLWLLHSAPYSSSATVISEMKQLSMPCSLTLSAISSRPRNRYMHMLLSRRYVMCQNVRGSYCDAFPSLMSAMMSSALSLPVHDPQQRVRKSSVASFALFSSDAFSRYLLALSVRNRLSAEMSHVFVPGTSISKFIKAISFLFSRCKGNDYFSDGQGELWGTFVFIPTF